MLGGKTITVPLKVDGIIHCNLENIDNFYKLTTTCHSFIAFSLSFKIDTNYSKYRIIQTVFDFRLDLDDTCIIPPQF